MAGKVYRGSEEFESVRRELVERFPTEKEFCSKFGRRAPERSTMAAFYRDVAETGKASASDVSVTRTTLNKVADCLGIRNRFFYTYQYLKLGLGLDSTIDEAASLLVGDFVYHRSDLSGQATSGGMRFFCQRGVYRFWHFKDAKKFRQFRKAEWQVLGLNAKLDESADAQQERLSNFRPDDQQQYDHKGYYFVQDGRLTAIGMDTTYFRSIVGSVITPEKFIIEPMKVLVQGRSDGGGTYAAKSLMYHSTNSHFHKRPKEEELMSELGVSYLGASTLHFS